jgi:hypothetical protein
MTNTKTIVPGQARLPQLPNGNNLIPLVVLGRDQSFQFSNFRDDHNLFAAVYAYFGHVNCDGI